MKVLFTTLGVQADDISPFCRDFTSLEDLRDEFIRYMPATFNYDHVQGTDDEEVGEVDDIGNDDMPMEVSVVDRVVRFTREITELAEQTGGSSVGSDKEGCTSEGTDIAIDEEGDGATSPILTTVPFIQSGPESNAELMGHFRALLSISSADELSPKVVLAMACLEGESRIVGAVSTA